MNVITVFSHCDIEIVLNYYKIVLPILITLSQDKDHETYRTYVFFDRVKGICNINPNTGWGLKTPTVQIKVILVFTIPIYF